MTTEPATLRVIRQSRSSELLELSALAILWGIARAIADTPSDSLDVFLNELEGGDAAASPHTRTSYSS